MFDHIIGNDNVKKYLKRIVEKGTIGNTLLFAGPKGVGKSLFAEAFAKLVLCNNDFNSPHRIKIESGNHPDICIYRPEGKIGMHSIASMRQFSETVYLPPFEAKYKVFIIHEAERMLPYSSNALLKTFEEPTLDTIIILLTHTPSALLPTVRSRCRMIHFQLITEESIALHLMQYHQKNEEEAKAIACLSQGSLGHAIEFIEHGRDPLRSLVIDWLSKGSVLSYKQLLETTAAIANQIEADKKEIEEQLRTSLLQEFKDNLSAIQKQNIEKEIEGALATHAAQRAHTFFNYILAWYRDLHMLKVNGDAQYALHPDYLAVSQQYSKSHESLSLEYVQKVISEAQLSLERSTSLNICLENLFLKLGLNRL